VIEAIADMFEDLGEEKKLSFTSLFEEVERQCKKKGHSKIPVQQLIHCMDELEYYNLIKIDKSKRDAKENKFCLRVELEELCKELERLLVPKVAAVINKEEQ